MSSGITSAFVNLAKTGRLSTYAGWRPIVEGAKADIGHDCCHLHLRISQDTLDDMEQIAVETSGKQAIGITAAKDGSITDLVLRKGKAARLYMDAAFAPPSRGGGYVVVAPKPSLLAKAKVNTPLWFVPPGDTDGPVQPYLDIEATEDIHLLDIGPIATAVVLA